LFDIADSLSSDDAFFGDAREEKFVEGWPVHDSAGRGRKREERLLDARFFLRFFVQALGLEEKWDRRG